LADEPNEGLFLSTKRLSFILSLVTMSSVIFGGFSTVTGYVYRVQKIESDLTVVFAQTSKMVDKVGTLNDQLVSLTITVNRIEERQDMRNR
jgi:hypothetical protein